MGKLLLSIVIPCFNEESNITNVYDAICESVDSSEYSLELIFVDDGSTDSTWAIIEKMSEERSDVIGIKFARNFGHAIALEAGMLKANGDLIVTMDADLQHPPSLIPELIEKWKTGAEVVSTIRLSTEGISKFKGWTSRLFYRFLNSISDLELRDGEADFRLITKKVNDQLKQIPESPKFYRGLIPWLGFETIELEYVAPARRSGKSSFSISKMVALARLGITSFSKKPLNAIIIVGTSMTLLALLGMIAMFVTRLFINADYFSNIALLIVFLIFVTGLLTIFQGTIAIYIVDIFLFAKGRPSFVVAKEIKRIK